jgi:hypothetical protein
MSEAYQTRFQVQASARSTCCRTGKWVKLPLSSDSKLTRGQPHYRLFRSRMGARIGATVLSVGTCGQFRIQIAGGQTTSIIGRETLIPAFFATHYPFFPTTIY